jgi:signal transduction protein with GAF and PtsI domain
MAEPVRDQTFSMKVTAIERQEIEQAARMAGETAASWAREVVLRTARGKRVEVAHDKLEWLREAISDLAKLNTEVLRLLHEHTQHESPAVELKARAAAERKLAGTLERLGLDGKERP